ncbi:hypothetical protein DPMN_132104 [Dreissena polymorpha]|uniref:Uncharacterized protein n=1 Tax=Dreissena polymorpha TaxID=45954 RepID=A0A9D4FT76_DREPO|nr:hypothetical protein DPMN_132104 [Dreissena polymorpha]
MCIMSILPSFHVSSFVKKYEELLKLSQAPDKCDRQTAGRQTDRLTKRKPYGAIKKGFIAIAMREGYNVFKKKWGEVRGGYNGEVKGGGGGRWVRGGYNGGGVIMWVRGGDNRGYNVGSGDRKINVASRVLTRKNAPPPGSHVFQPIGIIFELVQDIIGMNLLTKLHEDRTVNVASKTNLLAKFHEDSREKCPAPGGHVFKATKTVFELIPDIIGTNLMTKFHDDRKINTCDPTRLRVTRQIFTAAILTKRDRDKEIETE